MIPTYFFSLAGYAGKPRASGDDPAAIGLALAEEP